MLHPLPRKAPNVHKYPCELIWQRFLITMTFNPDYAECRVCKQLMERKKTATIVLSLFSKHPLQRVPGYVAALFCRQGTNKKTFQTKTGRDWPLAASSQLLTFPSLQALPFKTAPALWGWQGRVSRVVVMTESSAELNFPEKSTLQKTGAKMRKKRQDNDMGGQHSHADRAKHDIFWSINIMCVDMFVSAFQEQQSPVCLRQTASCLVSGVHLIWSDILSCHPQASAKGISLGLSAFCRVAN